MICFKFQIEWSSDYRFCHYMGFVIISNRKNDITTFFNFFIWFGQYLSHCEDCIFKSIKNWSYGILDFLNKPKTPGHCEFPLANPQKGPNIHFVTESNLLKYLILLYICSGKTQSFRRTAHFSNTKWGFDFVQCLHWDFKFYGIANCGWCQHR